MALKTIEWFDKRDRLPPDDLRVLIWHVNDAPRPDRVDFGRYIKILNQWRPQGCCGDFSDHVSHWAFLPDAPPGIKVCNYGPEDECGWHETECGKKAPVMGRHCEECGRPIPQAKGKSKRKRW